MCTIENSFKKHKETEKKTSNRFLQNTPNKLIMKFPWE